MEELTLVKDENSKNECDYCGHDIDAGKEYYASKDDHEIICVLCYLMLEE